MSETTNKGNVFSFLYRNRVVIKKGELTILNVSLLFSIISVLCAPWLVLGGFIAALALGYRFSFVRGSSDFTGDFQEVVKGAADNVKSAVDSVTGNKTSEQQSDRSWDDGSQE